MWHLIYKLLTGNDGNNNSDVAGTAAGSDSIHNNSDHYNKFVMLTT